MKEPRADATIKKLPEEKQEQLWALLSPQDGSEPMTLTALCAKLPDLVGLSVSLQTLSEWRSWYALRRRTERAKARAMQARIEWKQKNPDASIDELEELGQMIFTSETIEDGDLKAFAMLLRERNRSRALEHDARKLSLLEQAAADAKRKLNDAAKAAKKQGGISEETLKEIEAAANLL